MGYILGMDIGTGGVTGVFLDESLEVIAEEQIEHNVSPARRPGWMEHDAEEVWWKGFKQTLKQLMNKVSIAPEEILGIGCTTIGICMLPISEDGSSLRPALLYSDTRGEEELTDIREKLGREYLKEKTKRELSCQFAAPKILWFQKHEPNKFEQTNKILTASNYIVYKLTGEFVLDHTQAASFFPPLYDTDAREWNDEVLEKFGLTNNLFPELRKSEDIAGKVSKEAAQETGLAEGTPVITSTVDARAEWLSTGNFSEGLATLIYGSTSVINVTTKKKPTLSRLPAGKHPLMEGYYTTGGATSTTGYLTEWFRDNFGQIEKDVQKKLGINAYQLLEQQAAQVSAGSEGLVVLPYFSGERTPINDGLARGIILGLTIFHSKKHIYRALLEATGYAYEHHFEILRNQGIEVSKIVASGGGTKSDLWLQIVSDITGKEQLVPEVSTGAQIGVAYLVGLATGVINDLEQLEDRIHREATKITPNEETHNLYRDYYQIYRGLYEKLKDDMHALAKLGQGEE